MLDAILVQRKVNVKVKIAVKSLVSVGLIALAIALPQFVHLFAGAAGGVTWLPMYLPVLIGGCLLGPYFGLAVGVLSPVFSFLFTSAFGAAMPALARLPFMIAELAVFAAISGLFSKHIAKNKWLAFPAVLLAAVAGRAAFIALVAIFESVSTLGVSMIWSQIQTGMIGLVFQAVVVPFIIIGLSSLIKKDEAKDNE